MSVRAKTMGTHRPLRIAHRGARAFAPENTLEAIDKAASLGADMVELDVQLAADAGLIVLHDDTLDRCSDVRERFRDRRDYRVSSFTTAEIQSVDAGSWFVHAVKLAPIGRPMFLASLSEAEISQFMSPADQARYASGQVRHPTLEQALIRAFDRGLAVNIELKSATDECAQLVEPVLQTIDSVVRSSREQSSLVPLRGRVVVSSFDHASLRRLREIRAEIPIGVLVTKPLADPVAYCRELGADAYHPGCQFGADAVGFDSREFQETGCLPAEPFRALRDAGIAVNVWTENDPTRMRALIAAGVTGIFTDYPNRLRAIDNDAAAR